MWAHARTCVCDSARVRACGVSACLPGDIRGEILPVIEQVNTAEHKQGVAVCKLSEIDVGLACGGVGARSRHITRLRRRGGAARCLSRLSTPTANRSYIPAHHDFPACIQRACGVSACRPRACSFSVSPTRVTAARPPNPPAFRPRAYPHLPAHVTSGTIYMGQTDKPPYRGAGHSTHDVIN